MLLRSPMTVLTAAALTGFAMASASSLAAAETATGGTAAAPSDACLKAINALGAAMGRTETTAADGRLLYKYRVRTSGLDYDATCDAKTGVVGDVKPRLAPTEDAS